MIGAPRKATADRVDKKIIYPEDLINYKGIPSYDLFNATVSSGKFLNIRIAYVPSRQVEAQAFPWHYRIDVTRRFFSVPSLGRKEILAHEIGHFYETSILASALDGSSRFIELMDSKIFGEGKIRSARAFDNSSEHAYFDGVFGTYNLEEAIAESFGNYFVHPAHLKKLYPRAYKFVDTYWKENCMNNVQYCRNGNDFMRMHP